MPKDHDEHGSRLERLVEGVQDALLATERANAARHRQERPPCALAIGATDNQ